MADGSGPGAAGSVDAMHEAAGDAFDEGSEPSAETGAEPAFGAAAGGSAGSDGSGEVGEIEALPLADRAQRYQAAADRLRADLERSDPARGDA